MDEAYYQASLASDLIEIEFKVFYGNIVWIELKPFYGIRIG